MSEKFQRWEIWAMFISVGSIPFVMSRTDGQDGLYRIIKYLLPIIRVRMFRRSALQLQIRGFRFTFRFKYENRSGVWRIKCRITQFFFYAINLLTNSILLQNITH